MHTSLRSSHRYFKIPTLLTVLLLCGVSAGQTKKPDQELEAPTTVWSNNPLPCHKGGDNGKADDGSDSDQNVFLALGPDGLLYFTSNVCVFRLDAAGTVTRIVGGGAPTKSGEVLAGKATKAYLPDLQGIAVDSSGNVFVASGTRKIVEITRDGYLQTSLQPRKTELSA
jgi:hypothetical protein